MNSPYQTVQHPILGTQSLSMTVKDVRKVKDKEKLQKKAMKEKKKLCIKSETS